jgi:serine/threonine protein kinase
MDIYEVDQKGNHVLVVMEDAEMWPLQELLKQKAPFPVEKALAITIQMCEALEYIHGYGRQHQQICPQHIFATSHGVYRLLYLECKSLGGNEQDRAYFPYLAPEHLQDVYLDDSSDLYSLSLVLYQMLTGQLPQHHGQTIGTNLFDPEVIGVDIPEGLGQLIRKGLSSRRYNRFRSAVEMKQALLSVSGQIQKCCPLKISAHRQERTVKRGRYNWLILLVSIPLLISMVVRSDGFQRLNERSIQAVQKMMKKEFQPAGLMHSDIQFGGPTRGGFLNEGRR